MIFGVPCFSFISPFRMVNHLDTFLNWIYFTHKNLVVSFADESVFTKSQSISLLDYCSFHKRRISKLKLRTLIQSIECVILTNELPRLCR